MWTELFCFAWGRYAQTSSGQLGKVPFLEVHLSETVRKGVLRQWLGTLPSMKTAYLTDLSDAEWSYLKPHFPAPKATGRPRLHHTREILDAIFYIS